eukprot:764549-Hanusia_phi.AAC.3
MFVITTVAGGHNSGRSTVFLASGPEESERWIAAIQQGIKTCLKMKTRESESRFQRLQRRTRRIFSSLPLQIFFSLVILASFITAIISAESQPDPSSSTGMFLKGLEVTYLVIFAVELSMNLLSNWFWPFVKDGWNDLGEWAGQGGEADGGVRQDKTGQDRRGEEREGERTSQGSLKQGL